MISGEGTALVACSPEEALAFVLDLERYRQADTKIGRVRWVRRDGDEVVVRFRSWFLGLPGPLVTQRIRVTPGRRLDVRNDPRTLAARLSEFEGVFTVEAVEGGTRISHRESVRFPRAIAWFMERLLGAWLAKDTPAEVQRMKVLLEGRVMRSPPTG